MTKDQNIHFIVKKNTEMLSYRQLASARKSLNSYRAKRHDKSYTLYYNAKPSSP
jgi:hypothetical protein